MRHRIHSALAITLASAVTPVLAEPFDFQSSNFCALRVDRRGGESFGDPGLGFGGDGAWSFSPLPSAFTVKFGGDGGNLESDDQAFLPAGASVPIVLNTSHDYIRIFGGLDVGLHAPARVQPHAALHVSLIRQDIRVVRFDPTFGDFEEVENDSDTGLGYDATVGLAVALTRRVRLDAGVRYLWAPEFDTDEFDSVSGPEFALFYLGFGMQSEP